MRLAFFSYFIILISFSFLFAEDNTRQYRDLKMVELDSWQVRMMPRRNLN
jgi:hypothetical protein